MGAIAAIVVVVIVVLAAVAGLWLAGIGPFAKSGSGATTAVASSSAASSGQTAANGVSGGPWRLYLMVGVLSPTAGSIAASAFNASLQATNCSAAPPAALLEDRKSVV